MTRRTSVLVLGVCTGIFLLLFGNVAAITEASAAISEKSDPQKATVLQGTILTGVSSTYQNQSIGEKDGQNVNRTNQKAYNGEDGSRDSISTENASQDEEKNDVSSSSSNSSDATHMSSQGTRSSENFENSSDESRKPKYGEISAESTGKSTSTKIASENSLRLSRTNELTIATTKPALNDSKQDNKKSLRNATVQESSYEGIPNTTIKSISPSTEEKLVSEKLAVKNSDSKHAEMMPTNHTLPEEFSINHKEKRNVTADTEEIMTVKSIGDFFSTSSGPISEDIVKLDEKKDKNIKSDYKEIVSKIETKKDTTSANFKDREDIEDYKLDRDREITTMRGFQHENSLGFKKDSVDLGTTASEALDLEKIDEKKHEGTISLINDTYVNYKTSMQKDPKASSANHSTDANGSREKGDPKEEVEVVKNVTHQPILKIVAITSDAARNYSHFNALSSQEEAVQIEKKEEAGVKEEDYQEQEVVLSATNATIESTNDTIERKSIGESESQVKLPETTTQGVRLEEQISSISGVIPSPIPQGRTIGFSGVNEFPNIEPKSTVSTKINGGSETISVTRSSQNNSNMERMDQKPYPYLKSSKESFQMTESSLKLKNSGSDITEETSAYENTIEREESEKKFVVTEPSVVIENSIQQQKSDTKNEFMNSTTESPSLVSMTVLPITPEDVGSTNETFPDKSNGSAKSTEMKGSGLNENDVSKEEEKVIADKGYDVTGNGITEISLMLEADGNDGKEVKSHSNEATESSTSRSTDMSSTSRTLLLNTDIQMEPEEAMMIRSTLVVTESTIVPLDKDAATEANKSTTFTTSSLEIEAVVENSTEPTPKNVTLQFSSNTNQTTDSPSSTLNPDESSIPTTTTSIEFEFIGLTEAISSKNNATEKNIEGRTFEQQTMPSKTTIPSIIRDSSTKSNSTEEAITTMKSEESTELPQTTEDGSPTTDQISTTDNETTESRELPVTQPAVENQNNRTELVKNEVTTSAIDFTGAAVDASTATDVTEYPSEAKDSSFDTNVTETSVPGATELPQPNPGIAIPSTTSVAKDPLIPLSTSTVEPKILWSTPGFTELPEEETTESIQTLSADEITLLVKIVIEDTLHEVCSHLQDLKKALAEVLTDSMEKLVLPRQIIIHQNPCSESTSSSPTSADVSLTSILVYVVDEDNKFDATMTKILSSLYKVSHHFPVRIQKFLLVQETDSGNAIAVVVVSSVAFICLVLLAGLLFIMRKRQTRFNYGERCRPVSLDAYSLDSVSAYNSVRRKGAARSSKRSYGNPTFEDSSAIPSHPLNFAGLSSFCNDVNAINEEFSNIPQVSAKIDELPPGAEVKNRYANVIPLPETRVPLQKLNNDALTEYINASYVRGPKNATKYYIACQAPMESTVTDFWRMIWEQQCKVIIMLTDLVENGVEKCTEYIPPSEVTDCHRLYGDFQVTLKKRETKEKYAISTLHLKNLENNTFREVFHIWYLWPVSGVQSDGAGLIAVLLEARALQRGGPGPIVVHCSPGTGRTGTLIALDLGIRQYEITRTVDVPRVVYTIRRDRAGAVQTKEQYAFIYKALNLYATKLAGGVLDST